MGGGGVGRNKEGIVTGRNVNIGESESTHLLLVKSKYNDSRKKNIGSAGN